MLVISNEELEFFEEVSLKSFENDMVVHVKKFFPNHYKTAGEAVIREVIRYGIDQAECYEFTTERNVCLYITVMFMLGSNFDDDLMYPWAQDILSTRALDPSRRVDKLADTAVDFVDEIAGPKDMYLNLAFHNLREVLFEINDDSELAESDERMKEMLKRIYPTKYDSLGNDIIGQLISNGASMTSTYGIQARRGRALYTAVMFVMGSSIDREPFLTWIKAISTDKSTDEDSKVDHLFSESIAFLDKWLELPS